MTAVIDRTDPVSAPRMSRKKRVWVSIVAAVAVVAVAVTAVFAVGYYLDLQDERRLAATQNRQIAALQQAISEQSAQLQSQQAALSSLQSAVTSQESVITSQEALITSQEAVISDQQATISKQESTIKQQAATIDSLRPPEVVKGVADYPDIDIAAIKDKKLVALTFDDGPGPYTAKLLDALKARGARATFFVVGTRVTKYPDLIKRMEAEGHVVGNHTQNHKNLKYVSSSVLNSEIGTTAEAIKTVLGHYPVVMRCPGGNYNTTVRNHVAKLGIPIIQWSVDPVDWRDRNTATIVSRVKSGVSDGAIVLMHDIYSTTVNAAITLIDDLQKQGYTLVTVPELLAAKHGTIEPGKVYFNGYKT